MNFLIFTIKAIFENLIFFNWKLILFKTVARFTIYAQISRVIS